MEIERIVMIDEMEKMKKFERNIMKKREGLLVEEVVDIIKERIGKLRMVKRIIKKKRVGLVEENERKVECGG